MAEAYTGGRNAAHTLFGNDIAVWTPGTDHIAVVQNVGYSTELSSINGRALITKDTCAKADALKATLDFSHVVAGVPTMLAVALGATGAFEVSFRHARAGTLIAGRFQLTQARFSASDGQLQIETCTAVSKGILTGAAALPVVSSTPAAAAAPSPGSACAEQTVKNIASILLGTAEYVNIFNDFSVETTIEVAETKAAQDDWVVVQPVSRTTTITLSAVVQSDTATSPTPADALLFDALVRQAATVAVSVELGDGTTITGNALPTRAGLEVGDGAQRQTLTMECQGAFTVTP